MAALGLADSTAEELLAVWSQPHDEPGPRSAVVVDADGTVVAYLELHVDRDGHEVFGYASLPLDAPDDLADALLAEIEERAAWWHRPARHGRRRPADRRARCAGRVAVGA